MSQTCVETSQLNIFKNKRFCYATSFWALFCFSILEPRYQPVFRHSSVSRQPKWCPSFVTCKQALFKAKLAFEKGLKKCSRPHEAAEMLSFPLATCGWRCNVVSETENTEAEMQHIYKCEPVLWARLRICAVGYQNIVSVVMKTSIRQKKMSAYTYKPV